MEIIRESVGGIGFFGTEPVAPQDKSLIDELRRMGLTKVIVPNCGEIYLNGNVTATAIGQTSQTQALSLGIAGTVEGMTYKAGVEGAIASVADATTAGITITDSAHGLAVGDIITVTESTDYDGIYVVNRVLSANTFQIAATFTETRTGKWQRPASLRIGSAGYYKFDCRIQAALNGTSTNPEYTFYSMQNVSTIQTGSARAVLGDTTNHISFQSIVNAAVGDVLWLGIWGSTDETDITITDMNLMVTQLC